MQVIRELRRINNEKIEIKVPKEFIEKDVEILVFPVELFEEAKISQKKSLRMKSYKCFGKKADFSRGDAYANEF